jgi:hypothetical protein
MSILWRVLFVLGGMAAVLIGKASLVLVKFPAHIWMTSEIGCDAMGIAVPLS